MEELCSKMKLAVISDANRSVLLRMAYKKTVKVDGRYSLDMVPGILTLVYEFLCKFSKVRKAENIEQLCKK